MIPSGDLKIITLLRNTLSVLILVLGLIWLWATNQEHWLKDYMEPSLVLVGVLITFCQFLITRWSGGQTIEKNKFYNIPNTRQHRDWLEQAKSSIADGKPDEALKILSAIKVESVASLVALLSGRWAEYMRGQVAGVLEHTDRYFHQISKDVMSLIAVLEAEMNTYGAVDKEVREYLQKRYANRLVQKLANRQPINLRRLPTTEGTSEETVEAFVSVSAEDVKAHIAQVFQAAYGRLLITGKPGAGKTVLLLQLELALLASETDLLPVILNLATWKKSYITLEPWLKELLPAELGATKKYAADVLQQNRLILLLDGLDEVEESDRATCLEAIGRYRAATDSRYVITSRIEEYSAISKDAPVNLQIEVGDLTLEQMEAELTLMGHQQAEAMPLLNALKKHPLLREAAQVPFYFNTLQLLFAGGKTLSDLDLKGSTAEAIREELTPQFVSYALTLPLDKNYTRQQAERWLSFLAYNMTKRNKVALELADLQYDWSPVALSRWQLSVATYINSIVTTFYIGLLFIVFFAFFEVFLEGVFIGFFVIIFASILISFFEYEYPIIKNMQRIRWSWKLYFHRTNPTSASHVGIGLFFLILCAISFGFIAGLIGGIISGLTGVIIGGLIGSLVGGYLGLIFGFDLGDVLAYLQNGSAASIQINHPYQRFNNSARMLHFSILQHWHLMYVFSRKGWLPWRIVPFLNDMVTQQLLECPDGATWRFRHRTLQDHFTQRWN